MENPAMSDAVQEALTRRGMTGGTGALNQMSPAAAATNPVAPPSAPAELNQSSAPPSAPKAKFEPENQDDVIVSALIEQLKNNQKLKKEQSQLTQSAPQLM